MKLALIVAGAVLGLVGLAIWLVPLYRLEHTNWVPMTVPISLISNFTFRTNCNANTPGVYFVSLAFDAASIDVKDDTPEDTFKYPRRIPANVHLRVAGRQGTLVETNLTQAKLGSESSRIVKYTLEAFELKEPDGISVTFSNMPSADSVRTGNPRLEIELSSALLEGRLMAFYLGKRLGMSVTVFGLIPLIIGLFMRSNRLRKETA